MKTKIESGKEVAFQISSDGVIRYRNRLCVPDRTIRKEILTEAHTTPYSVHPGTTKMYRDLKMHYWWPGMKKDVIEFVEQCLTCQQVKAEHQRPAGKLKPLNIPQWKWEEIAMDLVVGLPKTTKGHDAIWVMWTDTLSQLIFFQLE